MFLSFAVSLSVCPPGVSFAKSYYIWTDKAGTVHITTDKATAPEGSKEVTFPDRPVAPEEEELPPPVTELLGEEKKPEKEPERRCKTIDIREFGLISDSFTSPWSEVTLVEKYGPPCEIIHLGEVFIERRIARPKDPTPWKFDRGAIRVGRYAEKKQYIYRGDYSDRTTVITIVDGVVVKKERLYD